MIYTLKEDNLMRLGFISGVFVLLLILLMMFLAPSKPVASIHSNLYSTIIGLELSHSEEDILGIVGKPGSVEFEKVVVRYLQSIDLDYSFIFFYSLFFLCIFEASYRMNETSKWVRVVFYGLIICVIALDILENLFLSEILNSLFTSVVSNKFQELFTYSYFKWMFIFIILLICGIQTLLGSRYYLMRLGSLAFLIPFILALFSYNRLFLIEAGFVICIPGLIMYWVYFLLKLLQSNKKQTGLS
jgi:hypothetical protein